MEERVNSFLEEKLDMDTKRNMDRMHTLRGVARREETWSGETDCCPI